MNSPSIVRDDDYFQLIKSALSEHRTFVWYLQFCWRFDLYLMLLNVIVIIMIRFIKLNW